MSGTLTRLLSDHRVVVCVGTGGVGKTSIAAALGLASATLGRRTMVLTIDPARQLAHALGLETLGRLGAPVATNGRAGEGLLHAAMLDQKEAWDGFVDRHAPSAEVRDALLRNDFYQKLSSSLAGSTEYMAIEEVCRLDESGAYDLIVVDTPPAAHAVDFLLAPERIERIFDPQVARWFTRRRPREALRTVSDSAVFALQYLENALGARTLREVRAFVQGLGAVFGDMTGRAARARALLFGPETAFVLIAGPQQRSIEGASELATTLLGLGVPLSAAIMNRSHLQPSREDLSRSVEAVIEAARVAPEVRGWLLETWREAEALDGLERRRLAELARKLPRGSTLHTIPELEHDAHALADLAQMAASLTDVHEIQD